MLRRNALDDVRKALHEYEKRGLAPEPGSREEAEPFFRAVEAELDHIERIHEAVHQLQHFATLDMAATYVSLFNVEDFEAVGKWLRARGRQGLAPETPLPTLSGVREHLKRLDPDDRRKRANYSLELCDAVRTLDLSARKAAGERGQEARAFWPFLLVHLANAGKGQRVDRPEFYAEGQPGVDAFRETPPGLASRAAKESTGLKGLHKLGPPLTWDEVLYHYLDYLPDAESREKKEWRTAFPGGEQARCIECEQAFLRSKYNPYQVRCSRCSTRLRQRRHREKEGYRQ